MNRYLKTSVIVLSTTVLAAMCVAVLPVGAKAWEPTRPVEFIVPAGTGGGADQMARMIQGIIPSTS